MDRDHLERINKPLLRLFALLLIGASVWGIVNQLTLWNRSVKLAQGRAGVAQEQREQTQVHYLLPFTLDTGEEMTFWLHNNSPVLDYFVASPTTTTIVLRYWPDDMSVAAVNPLVIGQEPIRDRYPPSGVLMPTSILGLLLGGVLLLSGRQFGRRAAGK